MPSSGLKGLMKMEKIAKNCYLSANESILTPAKTPKALPQVKFLNNVWVQKAARRRRMLHEKGLTSVYFHQNPAT